jgi:hypothetical protein
LKEHFSQIFIEPPVDKQVVIKYIIPTIPPLVSLEHNQSFLNTISFEEVVATFTSMDFGKSLGLGGFIVDFFQSCCPIIREEVWKVVEESRISCNILQIFNSSFINLIPKEHNP